MLVKFAPRGAQRGGAAWMIVCEEWHTKELDKDDPALLLKKECSVLFISEAAINAMILVIMILVAMIWHQNSKQ